MSGDGSVAVVGAPMATADRNNQGNAASGAAGTFDSRALTHDLDGMSWPGVAYVFTRSSSNVWSQLVKLTSPNRTSCPAPGGYHLPRAVN